MFGVQARFGVIISSVEVFKHYLECAHPAKECIEPVSNIVSVSLYSLHTMIVSARVNARLTSLKHHKILWR